MPAALYHGEGLECLLDMGLGEPQGRSVYCGEVSVL